MTTTKPLGQTPTTAWGAGKTGLDATEKQLVKATVSEVTTAATAQPGQKKATDTLDAGGHTKSLDDVFAKAATAAPSAPAQSDSSHPAGGLKVDDKGVIHTAGGYQIEATGQFDWKITGPDGKTTRIWGDPHVSEGDGGEWMFKRNSTFMLKDGTRIDCTCVPYGNGATVTGKLNITCGPDRLEVKDIDKGKGKLGEITHDGQTYVDEFDGDDTFYMGAESDDWVFMHREVVGSEKQGEIMTLGTEHKNWGMQPALYGSAGFKEASMPGVNGSPGSSATGTQNQFQAMMKLLDTQSRLGDMLTARSELNTALLPAGDDAQALARRKAQLEQQFGQIDRMQGTADKFQNLSTSIEANRNRFQA
jgi:ribosomal protein L12E/L44/L45/RPP1/RPP2